MKTCILQYLHLLGVENLPIQLAPLELWCRFKTSTWHPGCCIRFTCTPKMKSLALLLLTWLFANLGFAYNESTFSACGTLSSFLPNKVFYPNATTYDASILSYPFLQLRLHPSCIVRPESANDVSTTISVLKNRTDTKFAIKGGGHNANAGFNNIQNGVTIDMQSLNDVELARGDGVIRVGAGALWQNVYDVAERRNRTVLGGRIGVVGAAGFLTGGMLRYSQIHWISILAVLMCGL